MKNPLLAVAKARRLATQGRPLSALLVLQSITASPPAKKRKSATTSNTNSAQIAAPDRPLPGSFIQGRFESSHGALSYKLYTPLGSTRRRMPLLVMLHGCGQSADDFASGTRMNRLADELGFLVLYPEQSVTGNIGRCWNWHRRADQRRGSGEPAVIAALTRYGMQLGRANPARVYVAGISAGATAAAIVAAAYPDLFVAVGAHSGPSSAGVTSLSQALSAMRNGGRTYEGPKTRAPAPTIVIHGDHDKIVHPANAEGFLHALRRAGSQPIVSRVIRGRSAGGRDFTRTLHRYEGGPVLLEDWVIHQSGHAWSGGSPFGLHTDPAGPDASREMMRFYPLDEKRTLPVRCGQEKGVRTRQWTKPASALTGRKSGSRGALRSAH